jgi:hypothetical protein
MNFANLNVTVVAKLPKFQSFIMTCAVIVLSGRAQDMGPCFQDYPWKHPGLCLETFLEARIGQSIRRLSDHAMQDSKCVKFGDQIGFFFVRKQGIKNRAQDDLNQRARKRQIGIKNIGNRGLKHVRFEIKGG